MCKKECILVTKYFLPFNNLDILLQYSLREVFRTCPPSKKELFPEKYLFTYVTITKMRKYRSRILEVFLLKSNHNTPSYEVYKTLKVK